MEETLNLHHHRKILLLKALNNSFNKKGAAHQLGVTTRTVYNMMKEYGIKQSSKKTMK